MNKITTVMAACLLWAMSVIAADPVWDEPYKSLTYGTNGIVDLKGYVVLSNGFFKGTVTGNSTYSTNAGTAAVANSGWPLQWPSSAITNAPWAPLASPTFTGIVRASGASISGGTVTATNIYDVNSVERWGAIGDGVTDDTAAINAAILAAGTNSVVKFTRGTYLVNTLDVITKPVILDFNNSYIISKSQSVLFRIAVGNPNGYPNSVVLKNATVINYTIVMPQSIVKIYGPSFNVLLDNFNIQNVVASHSLIWSEVSYGTRITNCKLRGNNAPAAIYLSQKDDNSVWSNMLSIDHCDISSNGTGVTNCIGVYMEGGFPVVISESTFQYFHDGAIVHDKSGTNTSIDLTVKDCYFEGNVGGDIYMGSGGGAGGGNFNIERNHLWAGGTLDKIRMDTTSRVTSSANYIHSGGFFGSPPVSYVGINNYVGYSSNGYTGTFDAEIKDDIRGSMVANFVNPRYRFNLATVSAGSSSNVVSLRPLLGTAVDEWRVVSSFNLVAGVFESFRILVSQKDFGIVGKAIVDIQEDEIMTLDAVPSDMDFMAGNTITGLSSGVTCQIVEQQTTYVYKIKNRNGDFFDGESLSNGTRTADQGAGYPAITTVSGIGHSVVTTVDQTGKYNINVKNLSLGTRYYYTTYVGQTRY